LESSASVCHSIIAEVRLSRVTIRRKKRGFALLPAKALRSGAKIDASTLPAAARKLIERNARLEIAEKNAASAGRRRTALTIIFLLRFLHNGAGHALEFYAGNHHGVAAAFALHTEIHSHTRDFPKVAAARVLFFHADDVADMVFCSFHRIFLSQRLYGILVTIEVN
jgi:hypothetical protein